MSLDYEIIPTSSTTIYVKVKRIEVFRVAYRGSVYFELLNRPEDPLNGTWVPRRNYRETFGSKYWTDHEALYLTRDEQFSMDNPSSAASKKIKLTLTMMVNIWATANPGLLVEGERKSINDDIERAERKRDELLAQLNEVDKTLADLAGRLERVG